MTRSHKLKTLAALIAAVGLSGMAATTANAQFSINIGIGHPAPPPPAPPVMAYPQPAPVVLLNAQQIDQLTGPIALYPDPLLAQLLPAATYPDDIAAAAAWLQRYPQVTDADINAQPWDPSVKAIVHYPTVLQQMAGNLEWTQALGAAFINQQQDVMDSIQRLRAQAMTVGSLATTPEQQVVYDNNYIQILPAVAGYVYVPVYDPLVIYYRRAPLVFHDRFHIGGWDDYGFDWGRHWVSRGYDWSHYQPGHYVVHAPDVTEHPWVRDAHRAAPVMPQRYVHTDTRDYRGYQPAPAASSHAFDMNQKREDVERAQARARENRPAEPAPAPRVEPRQAPAARPANPLSTNLPQWSHAAPAAPTFQPQGNPAEINAQSQRGHDSMHH